MHVQKVDRIVHHVQFIIIGKSRIVEYTDTNTQWYVI